MIPKQLSTLQQNCGCTENGAGVREVCGSEFRVVGLPLAFDGQRVARRGVSGGAVHYYFSDHLGSHGVGENAAGMLGAGNERGWRTPWDSLLLPSRFETCGCTSEAVSRSKQHREAD